MGRIKIKDLPRNTKIRQEEMKQIKGGEYIGNFRSFLTNPLLISGLVATSIAVPTALGNNSHRFFNGEI